jgi:hypothetical protein
MDFSDPGFFPVLPWDFIHNFKPPFVQEQKWGLASIKEANFTMAGFVWPEDLPLCEALGLMAILCPKRGFIAASEWSKMSDAEIEATVGEMIEGGGKSPAVLGYFITDEPGAYDFPALAKAVAAVKKYAPGKLAYINLYPDQASAGASRESQLGTATYKEHLERFAAEVKPQLISYDNYMVQYSLDLRVLEKARSYFENLLEIRRVAFANRLPFWNIVASNQLRPESTIPSPANMALQAYTTLAAGGRGVTWYTYYSRGYAHAPIDKSDRKTLTWHYLQEINRQLKVLGPIVNRLRSTGVFFTAPPIVDSLPVLPGRFVKSFAAEAPLMIGEFEDAEGGRFALIVNLSLERSVKLKVALSPPLRKILACSPADGSFAEVDPDAGLWLVAGQGLLLKFEVPER